MTQNKYTAPDSTSQTASAYKGNIDNGFAVSENGIGVNFQAYEEAVPVMTVRIGAGNLWDGPGTELVSVAAQSTATIVAPVTDPRIDLIVINASTGVVSVITGTESVTPSAPAITSGNIPVATITLTTTTLAIINSMITDKRPSYAGNTLSSTTLVDDATPQLGGQLDVNGNSIGDGTRELIAFVEDASAVNHVEIENEATGSGPTVRAAGDDTNIDLNLTGKGTGGVRISGAITLPTSDGTADQVLKTDGSGNISFTDAGGGAWAFVSTSTISADASVVITDLEVDTDYKFVVEHIIPGTDGTSLHMHLSTDNGSSFVTGSSYELQGEMRTAGVVTGVNYLGEPQIRTVGTITLGTGAGETCSGEVLFINPSSTAGYSFVNMDFSLKNSSGTNSSSRLSGIYTSTTAVDALRFIMSSGTLSSGKIHTYKRTK